MSDTRLRRRFASVSAAGAFAVLAVCQTAAAQPKEVRTERVVFGHLHVHPSNPDEHKKYWIDTLGGTMGKVGTMDVAKFPDGLIEWISPSWGDAKPAGGTKTTVIDHVAFSVSNLRATLDRVKAGGYPIVSQKKSTALVMGPDGFLAELIESKS